VQTFPRKGHGVYSNISQINWDIEAAQGRTSLNWTIKAYYRSVLNGDILTLYLYRWQNDLLLVVRGSTIFAHNDPAGQAAAEM
jgi:hypothetical protein